MVGKPLVEASMTGLNSILMAYGQTGAGMLLPISIFVCTSLRDYLMCFKMFAGKTHTLMAPDGLTTSVVAHIFALIGKDAAHSYAVSQIKSVLISYRPY